MGFIYVIVLAAHVAAVTMPGLLGPVALALIARKKRMGLPFVHAAWVSLAAVLAARTAWILLRWGGREKMGYFEVRMGLLFTTPVLVSLGAGLALAGLTLLAPARMRTYAAGAAAGTLASLPVHTLVAVFWPEELMAVAGTTLTY